MTKANSNKPGKTKLNSAGEKAEKPSPKSKKEMEDDDDDDDMDADDTLDVTPLKKGAKAASKKAASDDDEEDDAEPVADDWEKGDGEEDAWDPDFDEFDLPKSTKKAAGKKAGEEEDDFKLDDDMKEFDLFNDTDIDDEEDDDY